MFPVNDMRIRQGKIVTVTLAALMLSASAATVLAQPYVYALAAERRADVGRQRLLVLDTATNTFVAGVRLGRTQPVMAPRFLAIAPDGARIYAVNSQDYTVSVVAIPSNTVVDTWDANVVGPNALAVAVSPDSRRVYVAGAEQRTPTEPLQAVLQVIDVASRQRVASTALGVTSAMGIAVAANGQRVYVLTSGTSDALAVVDTATARVVATVPLHGRRASYQPAISPDGRFVYVTRAGNNGSPDAVQVIDTGTNTIVATTDVGAGACDVSVSPDGAVVYVPQRWEDAVRLHPVSHANEGSFAAAYARHAAFTPDSMRAYLAGGWDGERIYAVDTATHTVAAVVPVPVDVDAGGNVYGGVAAVVASPPVVAPPGSSPTALRASIAGRRVTLAWTAPTSQAAASYVVEGGVSRGQTLASLPTGSPATTFSFDAPSGSYFVRVHAITASGRSAPSNEIRVDVDLPRPPSAPTGLLGLANGDGLVLSWSNTSSGGEATSLLLDVSGAIVTTLALPVSETFSYSGVPPGTYTMSLRAANGTGVSAAAAPVTLVFPGACAGPPHAPTNLAVTLHASVVSLAWSPPAAGPAVTGYVLRSSGTFNGALPMAARTFTGTVPSGTYQLTVAAVNPCGTGPETAVHTLTVP